MTVPLPASPIPTGSVRVSTARIFRYVFLNAFLEAGFRIERLEELGDQDYPHVVALRARR